MLAACLIGSHTLTGQSQISGPAAPIMDNSFLIEEAYNQESGAR
jgi:hypothetical protein